MKKTFSPEILGKQYAVRYGATRAIKTYKEKNSKIIPKNWEFAVNKIDWGCYEVIGHYKT